MFHYPTYFRGYALSEESCAKTSLKKVNSFKKSGRFATYVSEPTFLREFLSVFFGEHTPLFVCYMTHT